MNLSNVKIKNFRNIEELDIKFKPGFNLIKGKNGKGKTSVLEAIAVGLGGFIGGIADVSTRHFNIDEVRTEYLKIGDGSYSKKYHVPTEVTIAAQLYGEKYQWTRGKSSIKASRSTTQPRDICRKAEEMAEDDNVELPILAYIGAGRVWNQMRQKWENPFRKHYFRTVGYTDALIEASNEKLLMSWCVKMEQISWQKEKKIAEYEAVKAAVAKFMDFMEEKEGHIVFYDKQEEQMMYKSDELIQPIEHLSAGYQSLIWTVFDIAYRMAVLNPSKLDKIAETAGVVLIDEIDMHLHPRWQWNVVGALISTFPNVQFIAATHAPILFASHKNIWIIDVDEEEVRYSESHYGMDVNTSMQYYQNTREIPEKVRQKVELFNKKMDDEKYEEAAVILRQLEIETAPAHPLLVELRTRFEFESTDWENQ